MHPEPSSPSVAAAEPRRSPLLALLVSLRPRQWAKNTLLLVPLVFAFKATDLASVRLEVFAILLFCLLSSAAYLVNDVVDREADRLHPVKQRRPVAAGELSAGGAVAAAGVLTALALLGAARIGLEFFACALGYLVLQALYSAVLKRMVVVDVFAIAAGFVLRLLAGAAAIAVPFSNWLYLCALFLSLFLALQKRRAELGLLASEAERHRAILSEYSPKLLEELATIVSSCTVVSYALYTLARETIDRMGHDRLKYTVPLVLFGVFRYLYLVHQRGEGGAPERVLFRDRPMQLTLLAYLALVAWAVFTRRPLGVP